MIKNILQLSVIVSLVLVSFYSGWLFGANHISFGIIDSIESQPIPISQIVQKDKSTLIKYSYEVVHDYFISNVCPEPCTSSLKNSYIYDKLFITILLNGALVGCQSGSFDSEEENRLFLDISEATLECLEDDRFDKSINEQDLDAIEIIFTFLYNNRKLPDNDIDALEEDIALGIHAIEVANGKDRAYFKESVPISKNYDLEKTLERLSLKAGLEKDGYMDEDSSVYIFDTITFKGNHNFEIVPLYRYNILVDAEDINDSTVFTSILLAKQFLVSMIDSDTGLLEYRYYPSSDSYSSKNNHVRQIATLWAITELRKFFGCADFNQYIVATLDHYLQFVNQTDTYYYITIDNTSKLAYNAFLILSLVNVPEYPHRDMILHKLAEGILAQQNSDGSYNTYFMSDRNSGVDFYPGEAMLSLMKLYEVTFDVRYVTSLKQGFDYYHIYWRENKNTAFIPWHTQTYLLLYQHLKDSQISDFVFEMNDWLIERYQIVNSEYFDEIGGFPKSNPRSSTYSYMEGIADAYQLAVMVNDEAHIQLYEKSLQSGTRFMLQNQYTADNTFYLENPSRAIGGFKESLVSNDLRNDYTQHAVMAMMKIYALEIFS